LSSELTVLDRTTGELLDLRTASVGRLARYMVDLAENWRELAALEGAVSDALVERCDQAASWTVRVDDPQTGEQFEVKTASPTAGTEMYIPDALEDELLELIGEGILNVAAASGALKRVLRAEFTVPWDADPLLLATTLKDAKSIHIAGVEVRVTRATCERTPVMAGIAKLRKVPGASEALDRAMQRVDPPRRRAKVTLKGRAGV
jgi:hypothetical protein